MKTTLILFCLLFMLPAQAIIRDEALSQKYEALIMDGEDKEIIEDQMTTEEVTPEDLELVEEMEKAE